jgi:hypothetical protein
MAVTAIQIRILPPSALPGPIAHDPTPPPTNPAAARDQALRRTAGTAAAIGIGASFLPGIVRNSPPAQISANLAGAGQDLGAFLAGPTNSGVAGGMAGAAGSLAGLFNPSHVAGNLMKGPLGVAQQVSEVGFELSKMPRLLVNWGEALVGSQRPLAQFSGAIAMAEGLAQRRQIGRMMDSGARTGGTTADLSDSLQDLYDKIQPMSDTVANVLNQTLTKGVNLLSTLIDTFTQINEGLRAIPVIGAAIQALQLKLAAPQKPDPPHFTQFMDSVLKKDVFGPKPVPRRGGLP